MKWVIAALMSRDADTPSCKGWSPQQHPTEPNEVGSVGCCWGLERGTESAREIGLSLRSGPERTPRPKVGAMKRLMGLEPMKWVCLSS